LLFIKKGLFCQALNINAVLDDIISKHGVVDILKIDTEGLEINTVKSIRKDLMNRIRNIYIEASPLGELLMGEFNQKQYGSVCHMSNKKINPVVFIMS